MSELLQENLKALNTHTGVSRYTGWLEPGQVRCRQTCAETLWQWVSCQLHSPENRSNHWLHLCCCTEPWNVADFLCVALSALLPHRPVCSCCPARPPSIRAPDFHSALPRSTSSTVLTASSRKLLPLSQLTFLSISLFLRDERQWAAEYSEAWLAFFWSIVQELVAQAIATLPTTNL